MILPDKLALEMDAGRRNDIGRSCWGTWTGTRGSYYIGKAHCIVRALARSDFDGYDGISASDKKLLRKEVMTS
jgi:hypothetical protein